jgi:hypothetical protein
MSTSFPLGGSSLVLAGTLTTGPFGEASDAQVEMEVSACGLDQSRTMARESSIGI